MCVHDGAWCKSLVPPYFWKVRMANLNCEAILASPRYVCGREKKLHTRARLVLQGRDFLLLFLFFGCLADKFMRYGRSNRFSNLITDLIAMGGCGRSYRPSPKSI